MSDVETKVRAIIKEILDAKGAPTDMSAVALETGLYEAEGGLGLDSLATAELSVLLEQEFGADPYSKGRFVNTLGELVDFYHAEAVGGR